MSYDVLRGLYLGESSNADITSPEVRSMLHVETPLDAFLPRLVAAGRDVVLTGNPGDGKSHLVRRLQDAGHLGAAHVELDLSAHPDDEVLARWGAARAAGRPFVLCANEGPLGVLLDAMTLDGALGVRAAELRGQLRRLLSSSAEGLAPEPEHAALIDLADRSVLEPKLIRGALDRICTSAFMPDGWDGADTAAGQNLMLLIEAPEARSRLASLITGAGRRLGEHVTFRALWQCVAFALTGGKSRQRLRADLRSGRVGPGTLPLDFLTSGRGQGALIEAVRLFGDPAAYPSPQLDEELWTRGEPRQGRWLTDLGPFPPPATLWGDSAETQDAALAHFASLKGLAALAHERGGTLLSPIIRGDHRLSSADAQLLKDSVAGLRACYLSPRDAARAPSWLSDGLPLWIGHSYAVKPAGERPHVAAGWVDLSELEVRRPRWASWLSDAMGPLPDVAWLHHGPSGVALRLDHSLLGALTRAATSNGPIEPPEPVQRFLARLSGWRERHPEFGVGPSRFAVIERPRGALIAAEAVTELHNGEAQYAEA